MRVLSLEVAGFRGFAAKQFLDLDADAVIVVGANGNGKTSLFDAILWATSGRIPRLGADNQPVACMFAETGQARVVLRLGRPGGEPMTITRVFDGSRATVSLEMGDSVLRGPEAEGRIFQQIWSEAATAASPAEALATAITRSVYLQQDLVRNFIDSVTPQERFAAVSELVGAGRVTELQADLERSKKAWSQATNTRAGELESQRDRLSTMESRLAELKSRAAQAEVAFDVAAWSEWWGRIQELGLAAREVPSTSREAASAVDNVMKQLDAARRADERRRLLLEAMTRELGGGGEALPDLKALRERVDTAERHVRETRARVSAEQARVTEVRRLQSELKEKSEQLRALATLALKHLGEKCPVCEQAYDVEATRRRLERTAAGGDRPVEALPVPEVLPGLLESLSSQERALSSAQLDYRAAERRIRDAEAAELALDKRLRELEVVVISPTDRLSSVRAAARDLSLRIDRLVEAQRAGEAFALRLSQVGNAAATGELQREIEALRLKLNLEEAELTKRAATGEQAQRVIEALREAASRVVAGRVRELEPLLSEIYGRIDVHPAFRVVRLLSSISRGRGLIATIVSDPLSGKQSDSPATVLSSSQMNALAVCTFLSLNLGVARPPLDVAILDDPLQSLDDINLLGLVDLLRRTKDRRQLFVSTHDGRFGELLARKLRPGSAEQRTVVIELEGWSRRGPVVAAHEVQCDPVPLRLVKAG